MWIHGIGLSMNMVWQERLTPPTTSHNEVCPHHSLYVLLLSSASCLPLVPFPQLPLKLPCSAH